MKRGLTLVEIIVGLTLLGIALFGAARLVGQGLEQASRSTKEALEKSDLASLRAIIAKRLTSADIRLSFFSGAPEGGGALPHSLLIPWMQPRHVLCRDLSASTGICAQESSLMMASFHPSGELMLPAICSYPDGTNPRVRHLVFDLGAGPSPISYSSVPNPRFSSPAWGADTIEIPSGTPLALFDPPRGSLWVSTEIPSPINWTQNPNTGAFPVAPPPQCVAALRVAGPSGNGLGTLFHLGQLMRIRVEPLLVADLTGSITNLTSAQIDSVVGVLPARVFPVTLLLMGPKNEVGTRAPASFGINACRYNVATRTLTNCNQELISIPNVESFDLIMSYAEDFVPGTYRYHVKANSQALAPGCVAPSCLPLNSVGASYPPFLMDESLVSMSGTGYSAMKQEFLRGFEIRLKFRGRASEEVVSVNLSP